MSDAAMAGRPPPRPLGTWRGLTRHVPNRRVRLGQSSCRTTPKWFGRTMRAAGAAPTVSTRDVVPALPLRPPLRRDPVGRRRGDDAAVRAARADARAAGARGV